MSWGAGLPGKADSSSPKLVQGRGCCIYLHKKVRNYTEHSTDSTIVLFLVKINLETGLNSCIENTFSAH